MDKIHDFIAQPKAFGIASANENISAENADARASMPPPTFQLKANKIKGEAEEKEEKVSAEPAYQLAAEGSDPPSESSSLPPNEDSSPSKPNNTGLPNQLKSGVENLSGFSLDDVNVHFNSSKPAQLQAHAYAQGTDIHVAAGQEKHLPHEAWHVVQQKQGRVQATTQMKGIGVNDDSGLEKEADVMGAKAMQIDIKKTQTNDNSLFVNNNIGLNNKVIQQVINPNLLTKRIKFIFKKKIKQLIEKYNTISILPDTSNEENVALLITILKFLGESEENDFQELLQLRKGVKDELDSIMAAKEVMSLAKKRAILQSNNEKISGEEGDSEWLKNLEVTHATNPLKKIGKDFTIGDTLASEKQIKNVHQTGKSLIGSDKDTEVRRNAEMGLFYEQKHRRHSFSRKSHQNKSETKGLHRETMPPDKALPKYGAVNMSNSDFGPFNGNSQMPLEFIMSKKLLQERTTYTSGDSLREWIPNESNFNALEKKGMVPPSTKAVNQVPSDLHAWRQGPIATHEGGNFGQVLRTGNPHAENYMDGTHKDNPGGYLEAQFHGEVRIDRDVDGARANFAQLFGNPRFESLYKELLKDGKIIYWYFKTENYSEGNLVTQKGHQDYKIIKKAWKAANRIWKKNNKFIIAQTKKLDKNVNSYLDIGFLFGKYSEEIKSIWDQLARTVDSKKESKNPRIKEKEKKFEDEFDYESSSENDSSDQIVFDQNIYTINNNQYHVNDYRIRHNGFCLWDSLHIVYGYSLEALQMAADQIHIEYGDYVDDIDVWPLLQELGADGLILDKWIYGEENTAAHNEFGDPTGEVVITLGLSYWIDGLGHFIPPFN